MGNGKTSNNTDISVGMGFEINAGGGLFLFGGQISLGIFQEASDPTTQLFLSLGGPSNPMFLDGSIGIHALGGISQTGKFDLNGDGQNFGFGLGSSSMSHMYSKDKYGIHNYDVYGFGGSVGLPSVGRTNTYTHVWHIWTPRLFHLLF